EFIRRYCLLRFGISHRAENKTVVVVGGVCGDGGDPVVLDPRQFTAERFDVGVAVGFGEELAAGNVKNFCRGFAQMTRIGREILTGMKGMQGMKKSHVSFIPVELSSSDRRH